MNGWYKLHRKITESPIFSDPDILRLWILCLSKATHKGKKVIVEKKEIDLEPGQFVTGRFSLHEEYNKLLPPRKRIPDITLWRWLKSLEEWGNLNINSTNKYSVVTVSKWSEYQEDEQQVNNTRTTGEQHMNTNKNVKNEKNLKPIADSDECGVWFEQFWNLYPKKQGKAVAEKKFKAYYKERSIDFDKVMQGTSDYIEFVKKERARGFNRQYMDGSTFVNQKRWNDDYKIVEVVGKRIPEAITLSEEEGDLFDRAYKEQVELNKKNVRTERRPHGNISDTPA